jgi:hypothetical protein
MSHVFEQIWCWICTNIVHINYNMEFIIFCMNLWKLDFTWNLYEPMNLGKLWQDCFTVLLVGVFSCCSWLFYCVVSCSSITLLVIPPLHCWLVFLHVMFHDIAYCSFVLFIVLLCCMVIVPLCNLLFCFVALLNNLVVLVVLLFHCCIA